MSKSALLTNTHIMTDYPNGFCVYEKSQDVWNVERGEKALLLTLQAETPALVMNTLYAAPYKSFTKREFQSVHNGSAEDSLRADVLASYNADIDTFKDSMRTIGCGSNIYFQCADGLFQACVQRSAPATTPEGVVNPGAFSCAAGGATGPLLETQMRELTEEMNVFIMGDGGVQSVNLLRTDESVSHKFQNDLFAEKEDNIPALYAQIAAKTGITPSSIESVVIKAHAVYVENLHEAVEENILGLRQNFRAVVADDPKNGDLSGVDSILVVPAHHIKSSQIFISDGETDQQGAFLNRTWFLAKPEFLESNLKAGTMKFSPVVAKILQSTQSVLQEISRFNP